MAFTSSIFLFVFFPICLLGFFLAHAVEKVGSVFKKLRLSDLFLVGIGLIFYGWASLDGIFWMVGMIFLVFLLGKLIEKVPQKTPARLLAVLCRFFPSLYRLKALRHLWESPLLPFRRSPILWTSTARMPRQETYWMQRCI